MSSQHEITEDIVFDLVSIHAANPEVGEFIRQVRDADRRRAITCHELLVGLTADTRRG